MAAALRQASLQRLVQRPCCVLTALLLISQTAQVAHAFTYGVMKTGRTTFYGGAPDHMNPNNPSYGTLEGSCGMGLLDKDAYPNWKVAALATANPAYVKGPTQGCGSCWRFKCSASNPAGVCKANGGSVVVLITDSCPECKSKNNADFDTQALTFAELADPAYGSMAIDYQQVPCSPPGKIVVQVTGSSGPGLWSRFGIENVKGVGEVSAVSVQGAGQSTWITAVNKWGAQWEVNNMPGSGPYNLYIVLADNSRIQCKKAFPGSLVGSFTTTCQAGAASPAPAAPSPPPPPSPGPPPPPSPLPPAAPVVTAALPPPAPAVPRVTCGQTLTLKAAPHLKAGTKTTRTCIYPASRQKIIFVLKYASHPGQTPRALASTFALTGFGPVTSTAKFSYDTSSGTVTATFSAASIAGRAASYLSGRQLKLTGQTKTLVNGNRQCIVAHIQICK